ncbi:MAG: mRNA surveillance protein pelota [Zestosphaera sp.]
MKVLDKDLRKGWVKVRIEDVDDLWVIKNVVREGDVVVARTTRDVKMDGEGKRRLPMTLAVRVGKLYFQPFASRLRIHGVVVEGPEEYGLKGSHHTLNVDVGGELTIFKESWSHAALKRLTDTSSRKRFRALLVAADFDEASLAMLYDQGVRFLNDLSLPGLRSDKESSVEAIAKQVAGEVLRYMESEGVDFVVVGSPAVLREVIAEEVKARVGGRARVFVDSVSIGGRAGIEELLRRDSVKNLLQEFVVVEGEAILGKFLKLLATEPDRVAYGLEDVGLAARNNAVETLLVVEDLLSSDESGRVDELLNAVEERGGRVRIIPAESPLAVKLKGLGGVIAVLRFALQRNH